MFKKFLSNKKRTLILCVVLILGTMLGVGAKIIMIKAAELQSIEFKDADGQLDMNGSKIENLTKGTDSSAAPVNYVNSVANGQETGIGIWQSDVNDVYLNSDLEFYNVGIGTDSPNQLLHVYKISGDNAEIDIQSAADNYWAIYHDRVENTNDLRFWNGDNRVVFTDGGNVGIGTMSPDTKLHVFSSGSGAGNTDINLEYDFTGSLNGLRDSDWVLRASSSNGEFQIMNPTAQRLVIDSSGNVSIPRLVDCNTIDTNASGKLVCGDDETGEGGDDDWAFNGGDIYRSSGNVGIGTDSPDALLELRSDSSDYGQLKIKRETTTDGEASIGFYSSSNTSDLQAWVIGSGPWGKTNDFVIGQDGTKFLIEDSTGNVGIGTVSPSGDLKLDIDGKVGATEYCDEDGLNCTPAADLGGSGGDDLGDHIADENIQLNNKWLSNDGNNEGIRVDDDGNVGIGISSPGSLLHVAGDATIQSLIVDDVFDVGGSLNVDGLIDAGSLVVSGNIDFGGNLYQNGSLFGSFWTQGDGNNVYRDSNVSVGTSVMENWSSNYDVLRIGYSGSISSVTGGSGATYLGNNLYYEGGYKYINDGAASYMVAGNGMIDFWVSGSGQHGQPVLSSGTKLRINNSGVIIMDELIYNDPNSRVVTTEYPYTQELTTAWAPIIYVYIDCINGQLLLVTPTACLGNDTKGVYSMARTILTNGSAQKLTSEYNGAVVRDAADGGTDTISAIGWTDIYKCTANGTVMITLQAKETGSGSNDGKIFGSNSGNCTTILTVSKF